MFSKRLEDGVKVVFDLDWVSDEIKHNSPFNISLFKRQISSVFLALVFNSEIYKTSINTARKQTQKNKNFQFIFLFFVLFFEITASQL